MSDYTEHPGLPAAEHERTDVSPGFLAVFLGGVGVALALSLLLVWWIYPRSPRDKSITSPVPAFPSPELQPDPRNDMAAFFRAEMQYLNGTGWVDRAQGTVHVPIEQAMRKLAQDGIPDWPTAAPPIGQSGAGPTPSAPGVPENAPGNVPGNAP